jgi:hypothetical protein
MRALSWDNPEHFFFVPANATLSIFFFVTAMSWENPEHRRVMQLEGIKKAWEGAREEVFFFIYFLL